MVKVLMTSSFLTSEESGSDVTTCLGILILIRYYINILDFHIDECFLFSQLEACSKRLPDFSINNSKYFIIMYYNIWIFI